MKLGSTQIVFVAMAFMQHYPRCGHMISSIWPAEARCVALCCFYILYHHKQQQSSFLLVIASHFAQKHDQFGFDRISTGVI